MTNWIAFPLHYVSFQLLEEHSIEFKGYGLRDNVAQLSVFEVQFASIC